MNSLMSYGSDNDSTESGDQRFPEMPGRHSVSGGSKNYKKPAAHEDNYEEVGMDMSEDSDDSGSPPAKNREESRQNPNLRADRHQHHSLGKKDDFPPSSGHNSSYPQRSERRSGSKSPKSKREDDRRNSKAEDRGRDDRNRGDDKYRRRDERGSRDSRDDKDRGKDKSVRDEDRGRDTYKNRDDRRDGNNRYNKDRRDRDRKGSRSQERRRSRSPKRSKSPRRESRSSMRSRSGSRDEGSKPFLSRREKADKRMDRLDKLGIQFKPDNYPASAIEDAESRINSGGDRFFMPGITGRFRDQIEKRKQLWQKSKEPDTAGPSSSAVNVPAALGGSKATKVYEATAFSDDKTSSKFKRLMGIKDTNTETLPVKPTDVLKKQQEMFTTMEAQYEVARTATHTMRGVGLGFGSFQR